MLSLCQDLGRHSSAEPQKAAFEPQNRLKPPPKPSLDNLNPNRPEFENGRHRKENPQSA